LGNLRIFANSINILLLIYGLALAIQNGATHSTRPLSDIDPSSPGFPVELEAVANSSEQTTLRADIVDLSARLNGASEMRLFFGTYADRAFIKSLRLVDSQSGEALFTREPGWHENNAIITMTRVAPALHGSYALTQMELIAEVKPGQRLAIWTQSPGVGDDAIGSNLLAKTSTQSGIVRGTWLSRDEISPRSRIGLLAYTWSHESYVYWILAGCLGVIVLGAILFQQHFSKVSAILCFFAGMTVIYAVICPPFHAPDEPDHFLTIAGIGGYEHLSQSALLLANRGHFETIKFRPDVQFSTEDVNKPLEGKWAEHISPGGPIANRSPLAAMIWPFVAKGLGDLDAGSALMCLRIFNTLILLVGILIGIWATPSPFKVPFGVLMSGIPTLLFFAMHWSNYIFIIAFTVASVGFIFRCIFRSNLRSWQFAVWGSISGCLFISGIAGIAGWLVNFLIAGVSLAFTAKPRRALVNYFVFFIFSSLVILQTAGPIYLSAISVSLSRLAPFESWLGSWFYFPRMLLSSGVVGGFLILILSMVVQTTTPRLNHFSNRLPWVARIELLLFAALILISVKRQIPILPNIESSTHGLTTSAYAIKSVKVILASFGFGPSDPLLVKTFWGGFGWIDSMPDEPFFHLMRLGPTLGIFLLLIFASTGRSIKSWAWLHIGAIVSAIYLMLLAIGTFRVPANLHGRYMIGFYLVMLSFSWLGFLELYKYLSPSKRQFMIQFLITLALATHVYCWCHLLVRYFG
jgi:hypothetical protein